VNRTILYDFPADKCSSDEFTCGDGTCIPLSQRCDWTEYHCPDGTDEFDCRTLSLNCLTVQYTFSSNFHIAFFIAYLFPCGICEYSEIVNNAALALC